MEIKQLLELLAWQKQSYEECKQEYDEAKEKLDITKQLLMDKLAEIGLKSAKNDELTVSIVSKPYFKVLDQTAAMDWLKDEPEVDERVYIKTIVDSKALEGLAKEVLKKTGEIIPGSEFVSSEYMSVRKAS